MLGVGGQRLYVCEGDRLVGHLNPRLARKAGVLYIDGLWFEDDAWSKDSDFNAALSAGLANFARFHRATLAWAGIQGRMAQLLQPDAAL